MSQPDSELVARAINGDRNAFSQLCERHKARLWRTTAAIARGPDTEDLAQEAVIRAWCAIETCRNATSFEAWLCRIAINAAHDYHRSAWKRRVVFLANPPQVPGGEPDTAAAAERRDTARRLRKAVAALPQRQCVPIWMYYFEQFSLAEIAVLEGAPESTIRSRIAVGMRRLRSSLSDLVNEPASAADRLGVAKGLRA